MKKLTRPPRSAKQTSADRVRAKAEDEGYAAAKAGRAATPLSRRARKYLDAFHKGYSRGEREVIQVAMAAPQVAPAPLPPAMPVAVTPATP